VSWHRSNGGAGVGSDRAVVTEHTVSWEDCKGQPGGRGLSGKALGGDGGGCIFIVAHRLVHDGLLSARGHRGQLDVSTGTPYVGGHGAGGYVKLHVNEVEGDGTIWVDSEPKLPGIDSSTTCHALFV